MVSPHDTKNKILLFGRGCLICALLALIPGITDTGAARAQETPDLMEMLQKKEAILRQEAERQKPPADKPAPVAEKSPVKKPAPGSSQIELMYNERFAENLREPLSQYGYSFFKKVEREKFLPVGDQYVVGPGDSIAIYFWGAPVDILKLDGFYTLKIDRDGKIYIPRLGVFYVWGLSITGVKEVINNAMAQKFKGYALEVTLGNLREFPVYVSGFVKEPGLVLATGVSSIMDILSLAGGVEKSGSLRKIVIRRNDRGTVKEIRVDLYDLFIEGKPLDTVVREGDAILVDSVRSTSGITGGVKRPAIYELEGEKTTVRELIAYAGGVLPSVYRPGVKIFRYTENTLQVLEGTMDDAAFLDKPLQSGDFVQIEGMYNLVENEIVVRGHVSYPGVYSWRTGLQLAELLKTVGILPDTNMDTAGIWRDNLNQVINFSPREVLEGKVAIPLEKKDIISFSPRHADKPVQVMGEVSNPGVFQYHDGITLLDVMRNLQLTAPATELKAEIVLGDASGTKSETVYLTELLVLGEKEANIRLAPGSRILIRRTEANEKKKSITILGQVQKPGVFGYAPGMTLYDLIITAGGYAEQAYPRGMILVRASSRKLQEEHIRISFMSMRENIARQTDALASSGSSPEERDILRITIARYEQMLDILQKKSELALGRIAIDVPVKLEDLKKSRDNVKLVEGDMIYVPREPNYVLVLGDVYNQMSLPYDSHKSVSWYLGQLGGMAENADTDDLYIIKANGKIISKKQYSGLKKLYLSIDWTKKQIGLARNFESTRLEQGDCIVVPAALKVPTMWRPILRDIAQIMFQTMSTVLLATRL